MLGRFHALPVHRSAAASRNSDCSTGCELKRAERGDNIDMFCTCVHVLHMSMMIQIRNVPDALHRKVKARAAAAGMSLSDYLLQEIRRTAEMPTLEEMKERLSRMKAVKLPESPTRALRAERESR